MAAWRTWAVAPARRAAADPRRLLALAAIVLVAAGIALAVMRGRQNGEVSPPGFAPAAAPTAAATGLNMHAVPVAALTGVACTVCHWLTEPAPGNAGLLPTLKGACLKCHPGQEQQLAGANTHPPFKNGECTACHRAHPDPGQDQPRPALLTVPVKDLCLTCHADKRQLQTLAYSHPPFANAQCTACHDPHAGRASPTLRAEPKELCFSCHQNVAQSLSLPVRHPPFVAGNCTSCHTPHASDQPGQLRAPAKEVCWSCHAGHIARMDVRHPPVREGRCPSCHEPHAGRNETLLRAPRDLLCLTCHRK